MRGKWNFKLTAVADYTEMPFNRLSRLQCPRIKRIVDPAGFSYDHRLLARHQLIGGKDHGPHRQSIDAIDIKKTGTRGLCLGLDRYRLLRNDNIRLFIFKYSPG